MHRCQTVRVNVACPQEIEDCERCLGMGSVNPTPCPACSRIQMGTIIYSPLEMKMYFMDYSDCSYRECSIVLKA